MFEIGTTTKYHHIIHTSNTPWFNIIQTMWICFELRQNWIHLPLALLPWYAFQCNKKAIHHFVYNQSLKFTQSFELLLHQLPLKLLTDGLTDWRLQHGFEMKCGLVLKFIPFARLPLDMTFHSLSWLTFARYLISFRSLNGQQMEYPSVQEVHVLFEE